MCEKYCDVVEEKGKEIAALQSDVHRLKKDKHYLIRALVSIDDLWLEKAISKIDNTLFMELNTMKRSGSLPE